MENPEKQKILEVFSQLLDKKDVRITIIVEGGETITIGDKVRAAPSNSTNNVDIIYQKITETLQNVGISAKLKGYEYLREAIEMCYYDNEISRNITKIIYPVIARKHNDTTSKVEKAIRHAIESSWNRGNVEFQYNLFGYPDNYIKGRPSNGEFIAKIADNLRIQKI